MVELIAFGTYHVDRSKKVENELSEFAEGVDVLFVEKPRIRQESNNKLDLLIRNPMMLIGGLFLGFFWGLLGFIITRKWRPVDAHAVDKVSDKYEINVESVDMNIVDYACDVTIVKTIFSWLVFVTSILLFILGIASYSIIYFLLGVIFAFAPVPVFATKTLSKRNERISKNILELFEEEDIEIGCLICGNKHINGITERLAKAGITISGEHKSKLLRRSL